MRTSSINIGQWVSSLGAVNERELYVLVWSFFPLGLMFIYINVFRQCAFQSLSWTDPMFTAQG